MAEINIYLNTHWLELVLVTRRSYSSIGERQTSRIEDANWPPIEHSRSRLFNAILSMMTHCVVSTYIKSYVQCFIWVCLNV